MKKILLQFLIMFITVVKWIMALLISILNVVLKGMQVFLVLLLCVVRILFGFLKIIG